MFVTNWISTTKIQKISEITNFFRHYFLSRTEVRNTKTWSNAELKKLTKIVAYDDYTSGADDGGSSENTPGGGDTSQGAGGDTSQGTGGETNKDNGGTSQGGGTDGGDDNVSL